MGLYQYEIITKPCLINENMTQVSELIYQKEQVIIWDYAVAHDDRLCGGEWGMLQPANRLIKDHVFFFILSNQKWLSLYWLNKLVKFQTLRELLIKVM